ncbi:hypothetical protein FS592_01940 [Serratia plymuthica]|nr:hypothetical protein FS592_01940 [Serratia plymuthica]
MLIKHIKSFVKWKNIMSTIRELTLDEMKLIGGCGDGNNGGDRDRTDPVRLTPAQTKQVPT